MPPDTHATLGASSSERWMNCPGSVALSEGIPNTSSPYAIEGTAAHELLEECLRDGLQAHNQVGAVYEVEGQDVEVTDEMAEAVQVALDHVRSRLLEYEPGHLLGETWHLERKFDLAPLEPPAPMFGTADVVIWNPDTQILDVMDLKYGQGVQVDAEENTQLRYYALGAVLSLKVKPDLIRMTIMQPRGFHPDGPIRTDEITFADLVKFKQILFAKAEETQRADAPLIPGEHCRFCPASAVCPAQHEQAVALAQTEFDEFLPVTVKRMSVEEVATVIRAAPQIRDWLNAVEAHANHMLQHGEEVPGFKLVEGRSNRKWKDEEAASKYLRNLKLRKGEYTVTKLASPAQVEKTLKKLKKKLPERLVEKPEGKPKIVPIGDGRPALPPSAITDFALPPESES